MACAPIPPARVSRPYGADSERRALVALDQGQVRFYVRGGRFVAMRP
jgi:hypothetical protein